MHHRHRLQRLARPFFVVPLVMTLVACSTPQRLAYPAVSRGEVVDVYHGTAVADPYRALEDLRAPATQEFVRAQNALAQPWLENLPQRAWLRTRLTELWNHERTSAPRAKGGRLFFTRNDGRQNQSILYVLDAADAAPRVLFDPNVASRDATVALARFQPSPDGKTLAYSLSDGGTDWEIWKFRRVVDGADLVDELRFTKFWEVSWAPDGSGVYYSRYAAKADDPLHGDDHAQPAVYFHKLGDAQRDDRLIYTVRGSKTRTPSADVSEDGRWLFVSLFDGYETNGIDVLDLRNPGAAPRTVFGEWDANYSIRGSAGDTLFVQTTNGAPRGRMIAVDVANPAPQAWRELVPQRDYTLEDAHYVGGRLLLRYVRDAHGIAQVYDRDGRLLGDVPVPGLGTLTGFDGSGDDRETFFSFTDYVTPGRVFRLDLRDLSVHAFATPRLAADISPYVTEQVFATSRDGTRVPLFVTHRRDLVKDGNAPTLLYGYGGFNISTTPTFRAPVLAWLEMGGIYVEANLRGGGEYGEAWHRAGTKTQKQNVFDDFAAAAEYLIANRYTRPAKLAISGRSNGGLLVGATMLQRPELFAAALPAVGVLDMLRYHTASSNARQWSSDYGLAENAEDFAALRAYSPVHNVVAGRCYPATLVTTADRDDRVVPWHSYKFAAALQQAQGCDKPVLIRIETRAGHGAGKPLWMQIDDFADQYAFVAHALGVEAPSANPVSGASNGSAAR